jgi:hypothetical protein
MIDGVRTSAVKRRNELRGHGTGADRDCECELDGISAQSNLPSLGVVKE